LESTFEDKSVCNVDERRPRSFAETLLLPFEEGQRGKVSARRGVGKLRSWFPTLK